MDIKKSYIQEYGGMFPMLIENETAGEYTSFPPITVKKDYINRKRDINMDEDILLEDMGGNDMSEPKDLKKKDKLEPSSASNRPLIYIHRDDCIEVISDLGIIVIKTDDGVILWGK
jgi:hypothetical protein